MTAMLWGHASAPGRLQRAWSQWCFGDWAALLQETAEAPDPHPADAGERWLLNAAAAFQLGLGDQAQASLERALADGCPRGLALQVLASGAHHSLAVAHELLGHDSQATAQLEQAMALSPTGGDHHLLARGRRASLTHAPLAPNACAPQVHTLATIPLGEGWAGNTVNTVIFRHHGVLTWQGRQYTAFYVDAQTLRVVQRSLQGDSEGAIHTHDLPGDYNLKDAHNSISLGIDRLGHLHLSYDHHGTHLRYRRTTQPHDIAHWTDELPMTGANEDKVTYPTFIVPRGEHPLTLLYRDGHHNKGTARLKTYDESSQSWRDHPSAVLSGAEQRPWTSNAYWNHPAIGADGSLHLSFVWRTGTLGEQQLVNNINMGYAWSPDNGLNWFTPLGQPYRPPITPTTAETIWPSPPGHNLINQTSMALDSDGRPHVVFYANDDNGILQYQHLWFDGRRWQHECFSARTTPFALRGGGTLQIPISRPDILIDRQDRVYALLRADFTDQRLALVRLTGPQDTHRRGPSAPTPIYPDPVGYAEPVIDRTRWAQDNVLTVLVQRNEQPDGDRSQLDLQSPAWLIDIEIA